MKNLMTFKSSLLLLSFTFLLMACDEEEDKPLVNMHYGQAVEFGDGTARSWVKTNGKGEPQAIGVSLSKEALQGLPSGEHLRTTHAVPYAYDVPLPQQADKTPFKHLVIDWNPQGHEPEGIYDRPHFDMHFYMISPEERMQIGADDPKSEIFPPASQIPEGYIATPGSVPQMGKHWADPASEEYQGQEFTKTFIYGSYNGAFTFYEPMITLAYLQSEPNATMAIKQPSEFAKSGFYPMQYQIKYDAAAEEYLIVLDQLTSR